MAGCCFGGCCITHMNWKLFFNILYDFCWVSCNHHMIRKRFSYYRSSSDYRAISYGYTRKNRDSTADPDIIANGDRLRDTNLFSS